MEKFSWKEPQKPKMRKNRMTVLNDRLFEQIDRLSDGDLTGEKLDEEIKRAEAVAGIANQIINNTGLEYKVAKMYSEQGYDIRTPLFDEVIEIDEQENTRRSKKLPG